MRHPTDGDRVFILTEGVTGRVVQLGAYVSLVEFVVPPGIKYRIHMENDEFIPLDEINEE